MEIKQIKDLMQAMTRIGVRRLSLKQKDFELELEREGNEIVKETHYVTEGYRSENPMSGELEQHRQGAAVARPIERASEAPAANSRKESVSNNGTYITSPMVGTFYSASSPEDPPFVKVGDRVQQGQVVCIIEAMKVMNEVKAETTGTIAEVKVENNHPVEFGSKLFRIEVDG